MSGGKAVLLPIAGFALWGAAFLVLYGVLSVGCRLGWHTVDLGVGLTLQRSVLVVILAAHLLALAAFTWWTYRMRARIRGDGGGAGYPFLISISFYGSVAGLAATVLNFAAVFWLTPCAP